MKKYGEIKTYLTEILQRCMSAPKIWIKTFCHILGLQLADSVGEDQGCSRLWGSQFPAWEGSSDRKAKYEISAQSGYNLSDLENSLFAFIHTDLKRNIIPQGAFEIVCLN